MYMHMDTHTYTYMHTDTHIHPHTHAQTNARTFKYNKYKIIHVYTSMRV